MTRQVVCPICTRARKSCTFFKRVADLKFDDNEERSAVIRSRFFRLYHADFCPTCNRDVAHCHEVKVAMIVKAAKKDGLYMTDDQMATSLEMATCSPPNRQYTPIMPHWWRPANDGSSDGADRESG